MGADCFVAGLVSFKLSTKIVYYKCKCRNQEAPELPKVYSKLILLMSCIFIPVIHTTTALTSDFINAVFVSLFTFFAVIGTVVDLRIRIIPNESVITMSLF